MAEAAAELLKTEVALVPSLWWYEVRNILVVSERRQRMTSDDSRLFLELLSSYPIQVDPIEDEETTFRLARDYRLSFYDAAYLSVAKRTRVPIATLDRAVQDAARAEGIPLLA